MNSHIDLLQEIQPEEYIFTSHAVTLSALEAFRLEVERLEELATEGYIEILELHFKSWQGDDYVEAVRVRITEEGKRMRSRMQP